jgi:hypothetical protein
VSVPLEVSFELPDGYVDGEGHRHRHGTIRPALARDEILVLGDFRVYLREDAFLDVMLARVVQRLGDLERVHVGIIERLSPSDRDLLERLYREINDY